MSLDGNGTYSPPAPQFPAIPNTIIYADDFNQIILDIATALSTAIFRDGQAAFTADQSMGGHKLTNLANGVNPQDATTVLQVFTDPVFIATTLQGFKVSGSMFQALMTTINLVASGTLKLTGTTLLDASASGEVRLPGNTSVGAVSAAELGYLNGVTSSVQAQFDNITNTLLPGKVDKVGGTAQDLALTGTPTAPTAPVGTNSNQVATMAALLAQAFSAALPSQAGNAGKFVTTDGTTASWSDVLPPQAGNAGKYLGTNGSVAGWKTARFTNISVVSASGSWTVPAGVSLIKVTVVGGGASGGSIQNTYTTAAAGGAGATGISLLAVNAGDTATITIGAGGQTAGADGGTTTFSLGATTITATGGIKGPNNTGSILSQGGDGGTCTGAQINLSGQRGSSNGAYSSTTIAYTTTVGGNSIFPGGGVAKIEGAVGTGDAKNYGCGGAGAAVASGSAFFGKGSQGVVIIEY